MDERGNTSGGNRKRSMLFRRMIVGLVLVTILGGGLYVAIPREAQAFPGEALAAAAWKEIRDSLRHLRDNLNNIRKEALKTTYDITYKNTLRLYLSRIAEDTAIWIASAGTGQKPLFITDKKYFQKLNDAAVGDFVARISTQTFGTNLSSLIGTQVFKDPRSLALIKRVVRNLHSPASGPESCNSFCLDLNIEREQQAAAVRELIKYYQGSVPDDPADLGPMVKCPLDVDGDPAAGTKHYTLFWIGKDPDFVGPTLPTFPFDMDKALDVEARVCVGLLEDFIGQLKSEATSTFQACMNECRAFSGARGTSAAESWSNLKTVDLASALDNYYSLEGNDFGILLKLNREATKAGQKAEQEIRDITPVGGTTPITSPVSGEVTVPSTLVETKAKQAVEESTAAEKTQTGSPLADVIGVFSNTLVQKITERLFKGKCGLNPSACKGPASSPGTSPLGLLFGGQRLSGAAAARLQYSSLTKIQYSVGTPAQSRFSSVDQLTGEGTIDSRFAQAIEERKTVQEALDSGLLEGGRTFGFDAQRNDATSGYSYRSMVYLRRARIIPVGWELAAQHIRDYAENGQVFSLQEVVGKFFDCGDAEGLNASPFCGLVDPNWVLKAPEQYCRRAGAGDEIISREFVCDEDTNGNGRINCSSDPVFGGDLGRWVLQRETDQCVDVQDCVAEGDDGSCLAFGYCYEEKPVWRFDGEACPGQYTSCQTYEDSTGSDVSYLSDTVNVDSCTAENAGCKGLCTGASYWGARDTWTCTEDSGRIVYADNDMESCRSEDAGCREYLTSTNGANIIPNASFEYFTGDADDALPDGFNGWSSSALAVAATNTSVGANNTIAAQLGGGASMTATVDTGTPVSGQSFAISYYGRAVSGSCVGGFSLRTGSFISTEVPASYGALWQQYAATFSVPSGTYTNEDVDVTIKAGACEVQIDNAQLTIGGNQHPYSDYGSSRVFLNTYAPNLIGNGDFSNDAGNDYFPTWDEDNATADDSLPDGWLGSGLIVNDEGYDDTTSVKLSAGGWSGQDVAVVPGNEYIVSGWIKTDGVGKATIRTECVKSDHTVDFDPDCELWSDDGTTVLNPEFTGTHPWTYVQYRITANQTDIPFVRVLCYHFPGGGDLFCDNLRIEEAPPSLLCERKDVGCELYTAQEDGNEIPGIVTAQDFCPADQVGCKAYQEVGIENIPIRLTVDPVYIIASTGTQCSASAVGCEEYTNLNELAAGGEAREYYSRIRQCVQSTHSQVAADPDAHLFYSWVGTEEDGYQLRKWNLLKSNAVGDNGPCTNLSVGTVTAEPTCEDNIKPQAICNAVDVVSNPDCVEFYDGNANVYYRLRSRTVTVSDQCAPYRNTLDESLCSISDTTCSIDADCPGGETCGRDNVYHILPSEATRCAVSQAFCREYKGSTGNNDFRIFYDNFEDGDATGWSPTSISFESLTGGGHSLSTASGTTASYNVATIVEEGQSYLVRLWAKGFGATIRASLTGSAGTSYSCDGTPADPCPGLTAGEWNSYVLGPIVLGHAPASDERIRIELGGGGFVDNVELIANVKSAYLIKGTSETCDAANVNCAAYRDRSGTTLNIKSFTRLCSENAIGCTALIDTQNSETPFSSTVHGTTTQQDRVLALINDPRRQCVQSAAGCEAFGIPNYTAGVVTSHTTTYLKNDPDTHASALCDAEANQCEEFRIRDSSSVSYFKRPVTTACDYRVAQNVGGVEVTGWFKSDTTEICPSWSFWCRIAGEWEPANTVAQQTACVTSADAFLVYPGAFVSPPNTAFCTKNQIACDDASGVAACLTAGGWCVAPGQPGSACEGGTNDGQLCKTDDDCPDASPADTGTCTKVYTGVCSVEASGCNAYRDPLDPVGCEVQCNREIDVRGEDLSVNASCEPDISGEPGCETYTFLRDSVDTRSVECNNQVNFEIGCRPFYDASNPSTIFNIVSP